MCKVTLGVIPVSLFGLPMMHVLVVTHLFGCVEIEIIALFLSLLEGDWTWGSLPRPETPGFPSKIPYASQVIQYDPNYLYRCPGNYRIFKDSQGNTVPRPRTCSRISVPYYETSYNTCRGTNVRPLIRSKFAKNSWKLDKVDKTRCTLPFQAKNRYDVRLANRRAPGVRYVLGFRIYLF